MSPAQSWLCGLVVKTPDWESVGYEFKEILTFLERKSNLISQILKFKIGKTRLLWFLSIDFIIAADVVLSTWLFL